jgi:hypothetical protein
MLLTLIRDTFTPSETLGKLYIDRKYFCDTIEPPVVPNTLHPKGCIPVGWYELQITRSPRFGRLLPILCYVPGFAGIRIHAGNNRDHTEGCILVGKLYDRRNGAECEPTLCRSRKTEQNLVEQIIKARDNNEPMYIDITDSERYPVERAILDRVSGNAYND